MIKITDEMIGMLAPNPAALKNAKQISKSGGFLRLGKSADETYIEGDCKGSGKNPYQTSGDFITPDSPVFRCSCPSRQFPCKHALAMLCEYAAGKTFAPCEIPEAILDKRNKQEARKEKQEKKAAEGEGKESAPKVNQAALAKKMKRQLEGLDLTEKFIKDVLTTGLASLGGNSLTAYQDLAKQLGDYYLPGPQALVNGVLLDIAHLRDRERTEGDCYRDVIGKLTQLHAVVKKARVFLGSKLDTAQVLPEDSALYEKIGHVWQLAQLRELGLFRENAKLVQLSFQVEYDEAKAEYVDRGWWVDLETGVLSRKENYRPVKALKYIKQDDTVFDCVETPCLYFYPGEKNKRIRWDEFSTRPLTAADLSVIRGFGAKALAPLVKEAKNELKNALSEPVVAALVSYRHIGRQGEAYVLEDPEGDAIELRSPAGGEDTVSRLLYLPTEELLRDQVLAGAFFYDGAARQLFFTPFSIVTEKQIVRLLY